MRDSLTVLAVLLIAVLTTALVGPYVVDWNAHRAAIEARLSALVGAPVTVRGPIELKLLPKPVLRLGSVAIGAKPGPFGTIPGGSAAGPSLTADEVDAELSLPAMLRGHVQVVEATLRAPHLDLAQAADGAIVLPRLSSEAADRVAIEHIGVRDGSVIVRLADGRRVVLEGIDLDGEATTLRGPFKVRGSVGGLPLRLATGALDGSRMRVKLGIDPDGARPALDLDGTLTLAGGPLAVDGVLSAAGALPLRDTPATIPWRATTQVRADASGASLTDVEVRAGDDLRAVIADGSGTIVRGAAPDPVPEIALKLHGAGLDLDNLAMAPKDSGIAPPQGTALLGLLMEAAGDRAQGSELPARLAVDTDFDTATIAGRTLLGATLRFGLGPEAGASVALSTTGPDGARLAIDGRVSPGLAFRGRGEVAASDLPRLAIWLKPIAPDLASWIAGDGSIHALAAAGDLEASAGRVAMRQATLRLEGSRLTGSLAYDGATTGSGRPRLVADLATERLELGALPDLGSSMAPGTDLDLALAAPEVRLSERAAGVAGGPLAGGPLAFHLRRTGDDLDLDRFSLVLGGDSISATGSRTGTQARVEARVDAPEFGPIAGILARLAPGPATAALAARAASLSPASGTIRAEAVRGRDGALIPTRLAFDGAAGGTRLTVTLVPDGEGADAWSRPIAATLDASAPDSAVPLREIGIAATVGEIGPGEAHATARGSLAAGFTVEAKASLGGTAVTYAGSAEPGRGRGRLTLTTPDLRPLLTGLGIVPAGPGQARLPTDGGGNLDWSDGQAVLVGISAQVAGIAAAGDLAFGPTRPGGPASGLSGRLKLDRLPAAALLALGLGSPTTAGAVSPSAGLWSAAPFGPAPTLPPGDVQLVIDRVPLLDGLEASDATLTLRATRTGLSLADASARLGGGSIDGGVDLARDGPSATLSGHLAWHEVGLTLGGLSGQAGGDLRLAGTGASPAALVRSLGGTGTIDVVSATLARLDPEAPARTAAAFAIKDPLADPDPQGLDAAAIGKRLSDELGRGSLKIGRQNVPIVVTGGVLRVAALKSGGSGAPSATDVTLDGGDLGLSFRTRLVPVPPDGSAVSRLPSGPGDVTVSDSGPIGGPMERRVDAADLVDRLQAQAVARAQERIDVIEQDIRERAYFNRQLKAIQADQAAARQRAAAETAAAKAAAEARQRDAARAKADEARVQAEIEAAARADAAKIEAAKAETEKRRFIDRQVRGIDGAVTDPGSPAPVGGHRHVRPHEQPDLATPPSIVDETPRASGRP